MRDRNCAHGPGPGGGGIVPQRPVRRETGETGWKGASLRGEAGERGAPALFDRDRASAGAGQGPAQAFLPAPDRPEVG